MMEINVQFYVLKIQDVKFIQKLLKDMVQIKLEDLDQIKFEEGDIMKY